MSKIDNITNGMMSHFKVAKEKFEFYEQVYLDLTESGKEYLRPKSREYKKIISNIQEIILPSVKEICPTCEIRCCKLYTPELSIYIAGTVGGFGFSDYMLVRCDTKLPEPNYENAERNLCPFSNNRCALPIDCRSYCCIQYFCDKIKKELDMQLIAKHLEELRSAMSSFAVLECLF